MRVDVRLESVSCYEREKEGIRGLRLFTKYPQLSLEFLRVCFVDLERVHRELHLAYVCAVVGSIDEHIDLGSFAS